MIPASAGKRKAGNTGRAGGSKRRQTGGVPSIQALDANEPFTVAIPDKCLSWVLNVLALLTGHDLGPEWHSLVETWLHFEALRRFDKQSKPVLMPRGWPSIVADWIKHACISSFCPHIPDTTAFATMFNNWWHNLQPGWRVREGDEVLQLGISSDWSCLHCSGINSILSTVAALFFWGYTIADADMKDEWDDTIANVLYTLGELIRTA